MLAVSALAVLMATQSRARLGQAYDDAGRTTLQGIAATFDDGFSSADLRDPSALQQRMTRLKDEVPELHKVSLSWAAEGGGTMLVQAGHEHDPDGTKRDVTTARVIRTAGKTPAPFDAPDYRYAKLRAAQAHFARLERPIGTAANGGPLAVLELHYDLKTLDEASQREQRTIASIAVLGAITVSLLLAFLLTNAVVMPVDRIRAAVNGIRGGDRGRRLNWRRSDELGDLARDFDRMADALLEAEKDPLTGLLNHRAFQERLGQELARARREGLSMAVAALDIDNFKAVNDVDGHAAGDTALRALAMAITTHVRPFDISGRVGGDEFMLALAGATPLEAEAVVERIRRQLADDGRASGRTLTISAGIASFPEHATHQERAAAPGPRRDVLGQVGPQEPHARLRARDRQRAVARRGVRAQAAGGPRAHGARARPRGRRQGRLHAHPLAPRRRVRRRAGRARSASTRPGSRRSAPPACCTTSARSASPTRSCSSPAASTRRSSTR